MIFIRIFDHAEKSKQSNEIFMPVGGVPGLFRCRNKSKALAANTKAIMEKAVDNLGIDFGKPWFFGTV